MKDRFIAKYTDDRGIPRVVFFSKAKHDEQSAAAYLEDKGVRNFFFFFETNEPVPFKDGVMFNGEIGWDITANNIIPEIEQGKHIYIDSVGGSLYEGLKIYDAIKLQGSNPKITVLGMCASAATLPLLATENRHATPQSRLLIHNPFVEVEGDDVELRRVAGSLEKEKNKVADIYASVSGRTREDMLQIMSEERWMYFDEALTLNFIKPLDPVNGKEDIIINNSNSKKMTKDQTVLNTIGDKIDAIFRKLFPPKNIIIQDVNGVEIDFGDSAQTEEEIAVGATATVNGDPANGEYTLNDGTIYVFEAGVLTEIREPMEEEQVSEEVEQLQTENEQLQTENAALQARYDELKADYDAKINELNLVKTDVQTVKNEFESFKNKFSNEKPAINTPPTDESPKALKGFKYNRK